MRSRAAPHACPLYGGRLHAIGTRRRHFIRDDGEPADAPTHCPVQRTVAKITMERACATRKTAVTMYA